MAEQLRKSKGRTQERKSLRAQYVSVAALVALLLIGGSTIASMYVRNVTATNAAALQLRDTVTEAIGDIRNSVWRADTALNATLISPETNHREAIERDLEAAEQRLTTLIGDEAIQSAGLSNTILDLHTDLGILKNVVYQLMELRQDPNWVYPMLPFISNTLFESHTEFESSTAIALSEIAMNDGGPYATDLYRRVDEIRDLWRLKILNFRAVIVRFAGLNRLDQISQERNIDLIHQQIQDKLEELEALREKGILGFETEAALERMQYRSAKWYRDFQDLKKLRDSRIWRADIQFLEEKIHPYHEHVFEDLTDLENQVSAWSSRNVAAVNQAANQINLELWILSGLALGFVVLVYVMIDRSVLVPVARIATAISGKSGTIERLEAPGKSSREIHALINAFNAMRLQIQHRQAALQHQALHDSLTGLPNRSLLHDRLNHGIHLARRNGSNLAIMLLDLNHFKEINDTLGHPVGDRVLQHIGERLVGALRESDTVARLGGDEFALIMPDTDRAKTRAFLEKVANTIDRVVNIERQNLYVSASIGVALYPEHGTDAATLIRHADIAMYRAKHGNMAYAFFEDSMDRHSVDNLSLLGDLRNEIEQKTGQLRLYYQPKIEVSSRKVVGAEALLRWKHPKQGYVPPNQVITMAEQSGLIGNMSAWVLEQAISDCSGWHRAGIGLNIAVNLSAWNLQDPELPGLVDTLLKKYDVLPGQLTLEITESAVMNDATRAGEVLLELSNMGVDLAVDDYGTGFSSLAYLKLLPVHALKIDKSFVIDMLDDENDSIIVRSTIDLAHNLGLKVIAEGVESQQALLRLSQLKCDSAQGFYFSRPIPEPGFRYWYESYNRSQAAL